MYEKKIEMILSNSSLSELDINSTICQIENWLQCEWKCTDMSMEEYVSLRSKIEPIARRLIQEM